MKYRPLSLPRVPVGQQLTANLLADPVTPTAASLTATPVGYPSLLRRARFVQGGAHFAYVSPLPIPFPYDFPAPESSDANTTLGEHQKREIEAEAQQQSELDEAQRQEQTHKNAVRRMDQIESSLRGYEVQVPRAGARVNAVPPRRTDTTYPSARVVAFSPECHAHCLPHLAVGDVHKWIQQTSGDAGPYAYSSGPVADALAGGIASLFGETPGSDADARRAFSDWAAGRAVPLHVTAEQIDEASGAGVQFFQEADANAGWKQAAQENPARFSSEVAARRADPQRAYGPYALRYGGHQFGEWAGQLGDGRAVTLVEALDPASQRRWEVQLKGAGRTPFSRFGDGLATLKSSLREFLASEYMAALGIPTSRALAVTQFPDLPVARETVTSAAVAMRLAPSWLRIGNFEIHASKGEWESVRLLGEFVAHDLLRLDGVVKTGAEVAASTAAPHAAPWAERLVREVARRNARTCALWQAYGFMHGVLNTDNIALLGDTIDYGPYGFMDVFDEEQVCNHSDVLGRYSYKLQPTMVLFAIDKLLEALGPVIGFELLHDRAPQPGELLAADDKERAAWADHATEACADSIRAELQQTLLDAWSAAWCARLGVASRGAEVDKEELIDPLTEVLAGLDMTRAMRYLCRFPTASASPEAFAQAWVAHARHGNGAASDKDTAVHVEAARAWLVRYASWLDAAETSAADIVSAMRQKNPAFTLRNWITDEVAERLEGHNDTATVERVRKLCSYPFEDLSADDARYGEVGTLLRGHLPSCSS
ncbi:hypothetical protein MBRA1_002987 [Malassezia brasiliensis]|uniref:Selenoprotein O n=1 Tax=Malassezia brasiliensis TaxID=1821822 RepID=A0AAF0IQN8_9BASI|nr:hypothetical protein MBRA1_002987 [Malassezia brasiliensis]